MAKQIDDMEALDWVVRVGDPQFSDWEGFQAWLDADTRNAERYHALTADVDDMVGLVAADAKLVLVPAARAPLERRWRSRWIGGAIAASLALVVGYSTLHQREQPYAVETAAGAMRTVALADGSAITLNGATRITLDRSDPRVAVLDHGQAMFLIRHDAGNPFKVTVGGEQLVDVGTAFDVKRTRDETRVAVSEGAVDYHIDRRSIRLTAGQGLTVRDGAVPAMSTQIDTPSVGSWRTGNLAYDGIPLSEVAGDLSRSLGIAVMADRSVAARPFYGSIAVANIRRDPRQMAAVLDVAVRRTGDTWVLTANP